jgi:hypothetical protein
MFSVTDSSIGAPEGLRLSTLSVRPVRERTLLGPSTGKSGPAGDSKGALAGLARGERRNSPSPHWSLKS